MAIATQQLKAIMFNYKQTEVGVIPEEWGVKRLGDIASIATGSTPPTRDAANYGDEFLFVSPVDLGEVKYISRTEKRLSKKGFAISRSFPKDSILFVCIGSTIGKCGIAPTELTSNQQINAIFPSSACSTDYLYYAVSAVAPKIRALAGEQAVPIVNKTQFSETVVAIPPLPEQRAIAEVLTDVDELIGALDGLITKKRDLKQAAMQQLLTGQKRLPGFGTAKSTFRQTEIGRLPEDWPVVRVNEVTRSHKQGYYTKDQYVDAGVRLVRITDLQNPRTEDAAMPMLRLSASDHNLYRIHVGDFLFARSGAIGRYGIVYEDIDAVFGSYIIRFSFDSDKLKNEFFGYLYETEVVWKQLLSITQGSSNININAFNIKSINIPLPDIEEQTTIAAVLSDMDADIASLEQRRDKTRSLKQGMMQELLTGKTRLI